MKPHHTTEKITFYIGLVDKDGQRLDDKSAAQTVADYLGDITDGFNLSYASGYWKGQSEPCLIASFLNLDGASRHGVELIAKAIKEDLNQDAVLVEYQTVSYDMIE